jgi:hypothetical protein
MAIPDEVQAIRERFRNYAATGLPSSSSGMATSFTARKKPQASTTSATRRLSRATTSCFASTSTSTENT